MATFCLNSPVRIPAVPSRRRRQVPSPDVPKESPPRGPLGTALRKFRRRVGTSQDALADESGVPQHQISRIERGLLSPTLEEVAALERALGIGKGALLIASGAIEIALTFEDAVEQDPTLSEEAKWFMLDAYHGHLRRSAAQDADSGLEGDDDDA